MRCGLCWLYDTHHEDVLEGRLFVPKHAAEVRPPAVFIRSHSIACRIALVARMTGSARDDSQPHSDICEAQLLSANDMRVLSVALSRAAVEFSRRTLIVLHPLLQPQARCNISDLSLLSRSACKKAKECCAAAMNNLTRAAVSSLERCGTVAFPAS